MPLRSYSGFVAALGEDAIERTGNIGGIPGVLYRARRRIGTVCAAIILLVTYFALGNLVWDIRISGNTTVSDAQILKELAAVGVDVGANWSSLDRNDAETQLLAESETLSWISINRKGSVAYVEVAELIEGDNDSDSDKDVRIGNVVADRDCVIEEITVKRGVAAVKKGDVVKQGDVLISGIVETEGATEYCHAEGSVIGVSDGEICVFRSSITTETAVSREVTHFSGVKFFGFSINNLKKYGNLDETYAIIEEKALRIFGKAVPISLIYVKQAFYETREVCYGSDELVGLVSREYSEALLEFVRDSDLIGIKTNARFRDGGYEMSGRVIYSTDVGIFSPIEIKED